MPRIDYSTAEPATGCPVMSPRVILGPKEYLHGKPMHYAKLRGSTTYFRLGDKEVFLLTLMDGTRTPDEIHSAYAQRFRKRLGPASWQTALSALTQRGLVLSEHNMNAATIQAGAPPMGRVSDGPFSFKLVHWDLDDKLTALVPRVRALINGTALSFLGLAVFLCELVIVNHLHAVFSTASSTSHLVPRAAAFLCVASLMMLLHECSHAVACKRFGGQVREVGLLVRYFMLCAYTRVDDILLFQRRRERVYVLLIGPLVGLAIIPFALVLWHYAPPHSLGRMIVADLLIWYNVFSLVQFLPLMKFDGYYVLAQIIKMPELRTDSYNYLIALAKSHLGRGERYRISPECASYVEPACFLYGIFSFIATTILMIVLLCNDAVSLRHFLGAPLFLTLVSVFAMFAFWRLYTKVFSRWRPIHQ